MVSLSVIKYVCYKSSCASTGFDYQLFDHKLYHCSYLLKLAYIFLLLKYLVGMKWCLRLWVRFPVKFCPTFKRQNNNPCKPVVRVKVRCHDWTAKPNTIRQTESKNLRLHTNLNHLKSYHNVVFGYRWCFCLGCCG